MNKTDKKHSREIIQKGFLVEIEKALAKSEKILESWRENKIDSESTYSELFQHIKKFDKNIAGFYDALTPTQYLSLISRQIHENLINP